MKEMSKPPIGIMPRQIYEENRIEALKDAICRYISKRLEVPTEWIEEYNELIKRQSNVDMTKGIDNSMPYDVFTAIAKDLDRAKRTGYIRIITD